MSTFLKTSTPFIATIVLGLIFPGCALKPYAIPPIEGPYVTTIQGSRLNQSPLFWEHFTLEKIDGLDIDYGLGVGYIDEVFIHLPPGSHMLNVRGHFNHNKKGCPCEALAEIELDVDPEKEYQLQGDVTDETILFSIVDRNSGLVESGPIEVKFYSIRVIMIFVP